jgi:NAD(P) transhydrogenase subunit alpha
MPISVAVPKETVPGERRVALIPGVAEQLAGKGLQVLVQSDAGLGAFYRDSEYASARIVSDASSSASCILMNSRSAPRSCASAASPASPWS